MIFSIQMRHRIVRTVELVCPRCGLERTGSVVTPMRWACVGRWAVLPLGELDQCVRCDDCGRTSDMGTLDIPTSAQLTVILEDAWIAALVLVLQAGDDRAEAGIPAAERALADAGFGETASGLRDAIEALTPAEAHRRLRRLATEMTPFGKQGFLHRIAAVACEHASLDPDRRDALAGIGHSLGMAVPHVNGVLATADIAAAA